jgi:hypothetical protein
MPSTVNVLVMLAMRYNASPFTSDISGREALRSRAVWCLDHNDSFEDVISTEKEVDANLASAIAMVMSVLMVANACWSTASSGSSSGNGCAS